MYWNSIIGTSIDWLPIQCNKYLLFCNSHYQANTFLIELESRHTAIYRLIVHLLRKMLMAFWFPLFRARSLSVPIDRSIQHFYWTICFSFVQLFFVLFSIELDYETKSILCGADEIFTRFNRNSLLLSYTKS